MNIKSMVKAFLADSRVRAVLAQPAIGRPMRKIIWLSLRFFQLGANFFHRAFATLPYVAAVSSRSDTLWLYAYLTRYYRHLDTVLLRMPVRPKISVLIPIYKPKLEFLNEALLSVTCQTWTDWEICAVDDHSCDPAITNLLKEYSDKYPGKVKTGVNAENGHISVTSNHCLELATGAYIALLDHDDRLTPNALAEMVRHINLRNEPDILYSDEQVIDKNGHPISHPFFKPDWSPCFHLSVNYTTHLSVYRTSLIRQIGGFRKGFEGSQDHDLMLRAVEASKKPVEHLSLTLYHWRSHEMSTAGNLSAKPYAATAGEKAVSEACARRGRPADVQFEPHTHHYRVKFDIRGEPMISIIIPSRDGFELIEPCLRSLFEKSTWKKFEVIVIDNGSTDTRCLHLFETYLAKYHERFRVLKHAGPFNFAEFNNMAVDQSKGEFIVFLNNDTEVITGGWIEELLRYAQFEDVGAVGCKLLFPDHKIQHGGIVLLGRKIGGHFAKGMPEDTTIYMNALNTVHEVSGVTGACMMIEKKKFKLAGCFDETWVPNGYGDVDFCLKLRDLGFSVIYTPYAELYHHESPSRKVEFELFESKYMVEKWGGRLIHDPYLNFYFLRSETFFLDPDLRFEMPDRLLKYFMTLPRAEWSPASFAEYL